MKSYGGTIQNAGTQRYGRTKKTRGGKRDENERTYIIYKNREGKGKRRREKEKDGGKRKKTEGKGKRRRKKKRIFSFKMFCTNILHR